MLVLPLQIPPLRTHAKEVAHVVCIVPGPIYSYAEDDAA